MTPADELRAAAAKLREMAAAATDGPWTWETYPDMHELVHPVSVGGDPSHPMNVLKAPTEHWPPNTADAAWIALMGPDKGALLASWLDDEARDAVQLEGFVTFSDNWPALLFARAVLGEKP